MASYVIRKNHYFFFLLLVSSCFFVSFSVHAESLPFYSIYSFGDSGSLGPITSSHLADILWLPSPLPYTNKEAEFESGLTFMTPKATIMTPFFFAKNGISPPPESHQSQINSFMSLFYKDCFTFRDCGRRNKVLQKAIMFIDQPGFNDYKHAFLHGKLSTLELSELVPDIVETIKNSIERIINEAGAKHFLVSGILPMGCLPGFGSLHTESKSNSYKCHKGFNLFTRLHNDHLWQALQELRLKYPEVEIVYADYYKAFMSLLRNHAVLGFKTKTLMKVCCDPMKQCGEEGVEACSDRASHVHWDGFTLTPEASENLIDTLFSKKGFVFPEFKLVEDQAAAAERHHSKIYTLFRDSLRHLVAA